MSPFFVQLILYDQIGAEGVNRVKEKRTYGQSSA